MPSKSEVIRLVNALVVDRLDWKSIHGEWIESVTEQIKLAVLQQLQENGTIDQLSREVSGYIKEHTKELVSQIVRQSMGVSEGVSDDKARCECRGT